MEYFAGIGQRNFAVITPGRTILEKTAGNFTPGQRKSLTEQMSFRAVVITADNFATADMRAAMDDPMRVKLFIFTVQALIRPTSTTGRRTHKFQEGLGEAFYKHLRDLSDLVVFADEHHVYYGKACSQAVPGLNHYALIGLTATAHKQTPQDQIVYSYPLAAAIANQYVKRPRQSWSRQPSYLRSGRGPSQCGTSTRLYAAEHGRRQRYESTVLQTLPDASNTISSSRHWKY